MGTGQQRGEKQGGLGSPDLTQPLRRREAQVCKRNRTRKLLGPEGGGGGPENKRGQTPEDMGLQEAEPG